MPIRPGSRLRKTRTTLHGWKDGSSYCLSLEPRENGKAFNVYASSSDALKEASIRHVPIKWEDASVIE